MKRLLANFAILCVTVFIGTLLFEIFVRQFLPKYDPSGHLSFTTNAHGVPIALNTGFSRQIKNTGDYDVSIKINNLGLRESKELSTSTKSDVIVVGDSFSFGWGVEENERYSNRLDDILRAQKVFNISIPTDFDGYGKLLDYAKENGATINKLIIGVTMENDLRHYSIKRNGLDNSHDTARGNNALRHLKLYLRENSAAYFLTTSLVHSNLAVRKFAIFMGLIRPNLQGIPALKFSRRLITDSSDRLKKLIGPFDPIILIIPSRALWIGTEASRKTADKIHKAFIKELERRKINYVDPRSLIEKNKMPLQYHFKYDGHWTRDAHQIAAQALATAINAN
jgi:hypothetical protein